MMKNQRKSARWLCGVVAAGAFGLAMPAGATVKAGGQEASVNVGAAIPTTQYDLTSVGGSKDTMGGTGVGFGGQYLYNLTKAIGVGGEFNYASFGNKDHSVTKAVVTSSYGTWSLEAVARYVLMPESRVNPYIIAGLGLGSVSAKATTKPASGYAWTNTGTTESRTNFDGSATGVAFSIGAGADADITDSLFAGLDLRWRFVGAKHDYADGVSPGTTDSISSGSGLAVSGDLGWKFGG